MNEFSDFYLEDDAVEYTALQDTETINPDDFKMSPSKIFDFMSERISKTPQQKIETLEQVKVEAWEKYNAATAKNTEKKDTIEAKIKEYKAVIDKTNTDIVEGLEKLRDSQMDTLNARLSRNSKLLDTQQRYLLEAKGECILLTWNYEDKKDDIDAQILEINSKKSIDFDLSEGAKSGCISWVVRRIYPSFRSNVQTVAMKKGDAVESESISFLHQHVYRDYIKVDCNQESRENDFLKGRRDHVLRNPIYPDDDITVDTKNVSHQSLMLPIILAKEIPDKKYWSQGQGYCSLWGDKNFEIVYVLMNMPKDLVYNLAKKELGWDIDTQSERYLQFAAQYIYDDVPYYDRIKRFKFERDDEYIEKVRLKTIECRRYIRYLLSEIIQHEKNNCL